MQEILVKIQSGTATAHDFEELAKLSKAEAESKKKVEASAKSLIANIKEANIEPQLLTNLLAQEGLIVLPKIEASEQKIVILEHAVKTKEGRPSKFKVWIGRDCNALTADAKNYWNDLKNKGKDYFVENLNEEGKKQYEKDEVKQFVNGLFAK